MSRQEERGEMNNVINWLHKFLNSNSFAARVLRTFYLAFLGVLVLGVTAVLADVNAGHWSTAKDALLALVTAAALAGGKAVEVFLANWVKNVVNNRTPTVAPVAPPAVTTTSDKTSTK
ncbi:MAG: hypothetical protein KGI08_11605 [Thaumarchaeota archaeon]|nr:hypothetical protein [Nitrososphaerota archaeon]